MSLVIKRRQGESFSVIENGKEIVKIQMVNKNGNQQRIAITAPDELTILREELIGDDIERLGDL